MRTPVYSFLLILSIFSSCEDETPNIADRLIIEGQEYNLVKIGNQSWTASNFAGSGGLNYDAANTKPEYGKYYLKSEVDAFVLPMGWRIPTQEDYTKMVQHYNISVPSQSSNSENIKALISTKHWKNVHGTNASGFNAYPAGYIFGESIPLDGDIAEFWTAEGYSLSIQETAKQGSLRIIFYDNNTSPDYRFNVRLVKDN